MRMTSPYWNSYGLVSFQRDKKQTWHRIRLAEKRKTMAAKPVTLQNTNRWNTRQLVTMALMCAISALFSFAQIPLIPGVTFLTYDPSLVPAMVCGFSFGPGAGFVVGSLAAVIHGLILGEWVGSLMNIVATLCFVVPAALIYRRMHTFKGAVVGLVSGSLCALAGAIAANLTIGVLFWYGSVDAILPLIVPALVPFNLVKTILNSVLTLVVYKAVSNLITPKKSQVKGRKSPLNA